VTDAIAHVRPELARPAPYRWQEDVPAGPVLRFDMNTLPRTPAWWPAVARELAALESCSYPDATYRPLREAIGAYAGVPAAQVVPGAGADELLVLAATLAAGRGDRVLVARPTYAMYAIAARSAGAEPVAIAPRAGLRLDLEAVLAQAPTARAVFCCSPNNPTGEEVDAATLAALCRACPGLVICDQAYLELGGADHGALIAEHPNLVCVRTFSKGFGLAALRVGYALAAPAVAGALDALRPPGSIALASAVGAERACAHVEIVRRDCAAYAAERDRLAGAIAALGLKVIGCAGTFVSFGLPIAAAEAFRRLAAEGLVVRTFPDPALVNVVRACVAGPAADDALVGALARIVGREPPVADAAAAARFDDALGRPAPPGRTGAVRRRTRETEIELTLRLDGSGRTAIATGVDFLDHMLTALACHGMLDLDLSCRGDLAVDPHHTVEDCALALGAALDEALGDRAGIRRFADAAAPLDEALARCVVDLGGRGVGVVAIGAADGAGGVPASLWTHFFESLARSARLNLHISSIADDPHHAIEAAFKALALALRRACERDPRRDPAAIPSTKGAL
jgi:histidinol-phosphate/aromatic aminotransferase/cobyric acid decarboxylase-like protein/imidazoleglycerol phosphate dehydratase HisB